MRDTSQVHFRCSTVVYNDRHQWLTTDVYMVHVMTYRVDRTAQSQQCLITTTVCVPR